MRAVVGAAAVSAPAWIEPVRAGQRHQASGRIGQRIVVGYVRAVAALLPPILEEIRIGQGIVVWFRRLSLDRLGNYRLRPRRADSTANICST